MKYNHLFTCIALLLCLLVPCTAGTLSNPRLLCPTFVNEGSTLWCNCLPPDGITSAAISWPGHSESFRLAKENVRRQENGTQFTCLMEFNGQNSTAVYTLQVAYGPSDNTLVISGPPTFVTDGSVILTLTCNATEVNPPSITYVWSGLGLSCDGGNTGKTCKFRPRPPWDDGENITCTATNSAVLEAPTTVSTQFLLYLLYPPMTSPKIAGFKPGQVLQKGDNLTCTVAGGKPLVSDVHFSCTNPTLADQPDDRHQSSVSSVVTVDSSHATGGDTLCTCTADWEPGKYNVTYNPDTSELTVQIAYDASVTQFTINNTTDTLVANENDSLTVTLECKAVGQPTPRLRLTRSGMEVMISTNQTSSSHVEFSLMIQNLTCENTGNYTCEADNGYSDMRSVRMVVNCAPKVYHQENETNLPVMKNGTLHFSMVAHPVPDSFTWLPGGQSARTFANNIGDLFHVSCRPSSTEEFWADCVIRAKNVSAVAPGIYTLESTNAYGTGSFSFEFPLAPPLISCPMRYLNEGSRLDCECRAPTDISNPSITWPGHSNTSQLVKVNVSRHDNGTRFTCLMESNGLHSTAVYILQVAFQSDAGDTKDTGKVVTASVAYIIVGTVLPSLLITAIILGCWWKRRKTKKDGASVTHFEINNTTEAIVVNESDHITAKLECRAVGRPTPQLRLTRSGQEVTISPNQTSSGHVEFSQVIQNLTCQDTGIYSCEADNGFLDMKSVKLVVNRAPRFFLHANETNLPVMKNGRVNFSIVAHPVPDSFTWLPGRQNARTFATSVADLFIVSCRPSSTEEYLVNCVIRARKVDPGIYTLHVSNAYGVCSFSFEVKEGGEDRHTAGASGHCTQVECHVR